MHRLRELVRYYMETYDYTLEDAIVAIKSDLKQVETMSRP